MRLVGCRKTGAGDCNGGAAGSGSGNEFAHNSIFRHTKEISRQITKCSSIFSLFLMNIFKKKLCANQTLCCNPGQEDG